MKADHLIEILRAVEGYRGRADTPPTKRHLAGCVAHMVRAVSESVLPCRSDIENVHLAVCFLCAGRPASDPLHCDARSGPAAPCPFCLDRLR